MSSNDDDNQGLVLGIVFSVIAVVIFLTIGVAIHKSGSMDMKPAPAKSAAMPSGASASAAGLDAASVKVVDGVVKFYFASGKADVAADGNAALADIVKAVGAGKQAVISGYHDATGDPAKNAELAKLRAFGVRDVLKALGVPEDKVELKKPEQLQASGSDAEARRVEVTLK
jgi:outer membrane protein OmpA-like peptidoglycan-associated protein